MLTLLVKRPSRPGKPEEVLHKACMQLAVSILWADYAGEKPIQNVGVHVTMHIFEKPLTSALHQIFKRCTIKQCILLHCYSPNFYVSRKSFLGSKKNVILNSMKIWPFSYCLHLFQAKTILPALLIFIIFHNILTTFQMNTRLYVVCWVFSQNLFNAVQIKGQFWIIMYFFFIFWVRFLLVFT